MDQERKVEVYLEFGLCDGRNNSIIKIERMSQGQEMAWEL